MTDNVHVTTNNVPREILRGYELSPKERQEFDYLDWSEIETLSGSAADASFFRYKGELYDLGEFMFTGDLGADHPIRKKWDGYQSDSFFSGMVVRYTRPEYEYVVIGRYYVS